jgi:hypothetical protein
MLGEVGLDGGARVQWPVGARDLYTQKYGTDAPGDGEEKRDENGVWKRLTPFKTSMAHQRAILEKQLEIAVQCGVNVSFHSVAAAGESVSAFPYSIGTHRSLGSIRCNRGCIMSLTSKGPTMDALTAFRDRHKTRFTNAINVDLHSAGGWSPDFWLQAEVRLHHIVFLCSTVRP